MTSETKTLELPALEFRNVSFSFDTIPALIDVSFQLRRGEMIVLLGESGSGKSVLLRLAMGLLRPDSGQIFVGNREIENLNENELLAVRGGLMGMVFQEDSLFTGISVFENVAYRLEDHNWSENDIQTAVSEVLRFVGLEGEEQKFPEQLSGGMKRRVEIARALIGWPSIMLFDEPTMGLDPIVAQQILDLMIRARDLNKISSIYVTKKPIEIPYLVGFTAVPAAKGTTIVEATPGMLPETRVMVLEAGRVAFLGSSDEFYKCKLASVERMLTLEHHDHSADPYFTDPWDKSRTPKEKLL